MTKPNEFQLTGRVGRTMQEMRDLGFSQADREAEAERQTPSKEKCMRCKTADALIDYPLCDPCREVMRGWLKTDIEVTQRRK